LAYAFGNATRSWTDTNKNFVPDCNLNTQADNGECRAGNQQAFGTATPITGRADVRRARIESMDQRTAFYVRVAVAIILGPAIVLVVSWLAVSVILGVVNSGKLGLVRQRMKSVTPAIEQRDKAVEELTRP
jgi:hypothetical protein